MIDKILDMNLSIIDSESEQKERVRKRLSELMQKKDVKAYQIEKETGVKQASISQYLHEKIIPSEKNAKILGEYFNEDYRWILGEKEAMTGDIIIEKEIVPKLRKLSIHQRDILMEIVDAMVNVHH